MMGDSVGFGWSYVMRGRRLLIGESTMARRWEWIPLMYGRMDPLVVG